MVSKSGSRVSKSPILASESDFAGAISAALQQELGASRRAAKTVMAWTGVSGRTARLWLHGSSIPSGLHLVTLAAHCPRVLALLLRLSGHGEIALAVDLARLEAALEAILHAARQLRLKGS